MISFRQYSLLTKSSTCLLIDINGTLRHLMSTYGGGMPCFIALYAFMDICFIPPYAAHASSNNSSNFFVMSAIAPPNIFCKKSKNSGISCFISIQLGMHDGSGNPDHEGFHFLFSDQVIMNTYSNKGCVIPCAAFIWFTMFCIIDGICIFNAFAIYCLNMFTEPTIPPDITIVPTLGVNSKLLSFKTCVFKTSLVME